MLMMTFLSSLLILLVGVTYISHSSLASSSSAPQKAEAIVLSSAPALSAAAQKPSETDEKQKSDSDVALALAKWQSQILPPKEVKAIFTLYDERSKKTQYDMDVHAFNRIIGFQDIISTILQKDTFSSNLLGKNLTGFDSVSQEMGKQCAVLEGGLLKTLQQNLGGLRAHISSSIKEASETSVDVLDIFARTWSLAKDDPTYTYLMIQTVCDNSRTGGGCYPGHAGRLSALYLTLVRGRWFGV